MLLCNVLVVVVLDDVLRGAARSIARCSAANASLFGDHSEEAIPSIPSGLIVMLQGGRGSHGVVLGLESALILSIVDLNDLSPLLMMVTTANFASCAIMTLENLRALRYLIVALRSV